MESHVRVRNTAQKTTKQPEYQNIPRVYHLLPAVRKTTNISVPRNKYGHPVATLSTFLLGPNSDSHRIYKNETCGASIADNYWLSYWWACTGKHLFVRETVETTKRHVNFPDEIWFTERKLCPGRGSRKHPHPVREGCPSKRVEIFAFTVSCWCSQGGRRRTSSFCLSHAGAWLLRIKLRSSLSNRSSVRSITR